MLAQVPSPSFNLLNTYNMPASKASTNFPSVTNDPYTASDVNIIWSMSLLEPFTLFVNIASEPYKIISSREQVLYSIKHRD